MEKDNKTTVAVERTTFTKLDRLAKANNVSKMEFLTHAINYFEKYGINPVEHESPAQEMQKLIKHIHHIPMFSKNGYTTDLKPDDFIFVNGTVVRYSVNSNCYSLAKERIQVQIKDIIDMPDGEFENLVERLFNEAKKNLL